ncbi:MAG: hypothetical protein ABI690_34090 [Chloroflexota bacterium]
MDREQVIQEARDKGWTVRDIRAKGVDIDIPWQHWEVIDPNKHPVFRTFTEEEAWDYIYEHMMDHPSGET